VACAIVLVEHLKPHFHQVVAAELLSVVAEGRLRVRHQVDFGNGVLAVGVEALQADACERLLVAGVRLLFNNIVLKG
jgi:hypothetical protein